MSEKERRGFQEQGNDEKAISGIRYKTQWEKDEIGELVPDSSRGDHRPPAPETIKSIYRRIGRDEREKIAMILREREVMAEIIEKKEYQMINWWESDDPLVAVYGQLSTFKVLSDEEFGLKLNKLLSGRDLVDFYRMPNTDHKIRLLKELFPSVDFEKLLLKNTQDTDEDI